MAGDDPFGKGFFQITERPFGFERSKRGRICNRAFAGCINRMAARTEPFCQRGAGGNIGFRGGAGADQLGIAEHCEHQNNGSESVNCGYFQAADDSSKFDVDQRTIGGIDRDYVHLNLMSTDERHAEFDERPEGRLF